MIKNMLSMESVQSWLSGVGGSALEFLVKAALGIVCYLIVSRVVRKLCRLLARSMERFSIEPSAASFIVSMVKYVVLGLTVITIIVQLGVVKESSIAALLASAGVAISLALQGGLSNFAGGILILLLRPFRVGDYIVCQAEGIEGTVGKIEMYYTTVLSMDNREIMVPNATLTNNVIINTTAVNKRKLEIKVGISYRADLVRAKLMLKELVESDPRFLEEQPQYFVDALDESCVMVGFRAWVATGDYVQLRWDMLERVKLKFDEEGIEIPYSQLDVHIRDYSRGEEKERP